MPLEVPHEEITSIPDTIHIRVNGYEDIKQVLGIDIL